MKLPETWRDLNTVRAGYTALPTGDIDCTVTESGETRLRLLLLPEQMFALAWSAAGAATAREVSVALGRIIAAHAAPPVDSTELIAQFDALEQIGCGERRPAWSDLPGVVVTPMEECGRFRSCGLRCGHERSTLHLTVGVPLPIGAVRFSHASPAAPMLIAIARMVSAHAEAFWTAVDNPDVRVIGAVGY